MAKGEIDEMDELGKMIDGMFSGIDDDGPEPTRVFLICPVRGASEEVKAILEAYVARLEAHNYVVHYPDRDTNQVDPDGGINICRRNTSAIRDADEVHIYYAKGSSGSLFDSGAAFVLGKPLYLVNPDDIEPTKEKSLENVLLAWGQPSPYALKTTKEQPSSS